MLEQGYYSKANVGTTEMLQQGQRWNNRNVTARPALEQQKCYSKANVGTETLQPDQGWNKACMPMGSRVHTTLRALSGLLTEARTVGCVDSPLGPPTL